MIQQLQEAAGVYSMQSFHSIPLLENNNNDKKNQLIATR